MVEQTRLLRELVGELKVSFKMATEYSKRVEERLKRMHAAELEQVKEAYALHEQQLAEIVETAVARALAKSRRAIGESK
jgi:hypothetical protein